MAVSITLHSCSFFEGTAKHREKGTPIESTKSAVDQLLAKSKDNTEKRFSITGYLNYSASGTVYTSRPQTVYVRTTPGSDGETIASIQMHWSENGVNSVFVPDNGSGDYTKSIFYDNEGKPLTSKDKVTVSFNVEEGNSYLVETRIDKAQ